MDTFNDIFDTDFLPPQAREYLQATGGFKAFIKGKSQLDNLSLYQLVYARRGQSAKELAKKTSGQNGTIDSVLAQLPISLGKISEAMLGGIYDYSSNYASYIPLENESLGILPTTKLYYTKLVANLTENLVDVINYFPDKLDEAALNYEQAWEWNIPASNYATIFDISISVISGNIPQCFVDVISLASSADITRKSLETTYLLANGIQLGNSGANA